MPTITAFVPDWCATPELSGIAAQRKGLSHDSSGRFRGYVIQYSELQSCDVIQLQLRAETMPPALQGVPMRAIILLKLNSPLTAVADGFYEDGDITARVDTYVEDGVTQQSFRVTGTNGVTVEALNIWFDALAGGKKVEYNRTPITYPGLLSDDDQSDTQ